MEFRKKVWEIHFDQAVALNVLISETMVDHSTDNCKDVFLSHASKDKEPYVRVFARELHKRGISYWLDKAEIKWGDRITKKINDGLKSSRYVIVFLSENFLGRN